MVISNPFKLETGCTIKLPPRHSESSLALLALFHTNPKLTFYLIEAPLSLHLVNFLVLHVAKENRPEVLKGQLVFFHRFGRQEVAD